MDAFLHGVEVIQLTDGVRPITAQASSIIGLIGTAPYADDTLFPLDTPVRVSTAADLAALSADLPNGAAINAEGTLPQAVAAIFDQARTPIVVIRVEADETLADQQALIVGDAGESTGVYGFLTAQAALGLKPKILIATGFTHQVTGGLANPVVTALKAIANKLRAVVVADGPNDTNAAAIAKAGVEGSERVFLVDPHVKVLDRTGVVATRPASAHIAGAIARSDAERGFHWSPSNFEIFNVLGVSRLIEFGLTDPSTTANALNEAGVATIISLNGFRIWGNRTPAADAQWAFLSVRRTADMIYEAMEASFLWAMDRPISGQLVEDVVGSVQAYLRELKARGAVLGGKAWADPDLNTIASLQAGRLYINFDIEPPAPLERITFRAQREAGYYAELLGDGEAA